MERILAGLGKRVFLMNNVHEDAPVIFQTRWVMSYLRGPLARNQIKKLMDPVNKDLLRSAGETPVQAAPITTLTKQKISYAQSKPMLPPGVPQFYIPVHSAQTEGTHLFYEPALLGIGKVYFSHAKSGITAEREFSLLADFAIRGMGIDWSEAQSLDMSENDVERFPDDEADYGEISEQAGQKKNYAQWSREYRNWLYRNASVELFKSPSLSIVSAPGESERDFRVRLQLAAREQRDVLLEKISKKYVSKIDKMQERIHRAEQNIEKEKEQAKQEKFKTAISFGATIFSALLGRKRVSRSSMGRAATTARQAGRTLKEGKDIERAEDTLSELHKKLSDLEAGLAEETERIKSEVDPLNEKLETIILKPKKTNVSVTLVALAWVPYWQNKNGGIKRA
jgi:hypothetical protein